jgi:hypothetical protein
MKKRFSIILSIVTCMVLALSFNARANVNLSLDADCEGYTISGTVDNFCWTWHNGDCLKYTIIVTHKGGSFTVTGQETLFYPPTPDPNECPSLPVQISGLWEEELFGNVSVVATAAMIAGCINWVLESQDFSQEFSCDGDVGCNRTPGYWKNHPEAWPVEEITIGGIPYAKSDAIYFMNKSVNGDKTYTMFPALVAAKLNVLVGSDDSCVADIIAAADEWMAIHPVGSDVAAGGEDSSWRFNDARYIELDKYNNGELCVPNCDVTELDEDMYDD